LLERAKATGARSIAVVGTSKNAGKTVVTAALADALSRSGEPFGICSIGRDGEALDAILGTPKPRYFLRPGTLVATAAALLPKSPAIEIVAVAGTTSALGRIAVARVRVPALIEIVGPPGAAGLQRIVLRMQADGRFVLIDGALDRIAPVGYGVPKAIVVAVGAAGGATPDHALDDVEALVRKLRLPARDSNGDAVRIDGALTAGAAADLARARERRQIVVSNPTQIAFGGRTFLRIASVLDLRCERQLRVVACSVAPLAAERAFEPRSFARNVAARTGLPVYDVYAATITEPSAA